MFDLESWINQVEEAFTQNLENTYTSFEELYKEKPKVWTAISKLYSRANRSGLTVETKIYSLVVIWEYLIGLIVDKQFFSDILSEKGEKSCGMMKNNSVLMRYG